MFFGPIVGIFWIHGLMSSPSRVRYTQPDPAGGDVPAHSMVLEWFGNPSHVVGKKFTPLKITPFFKLTRQQHNHEDLGK